MRSLKPILLIEDDTVDAMTVKRAFNDLHVMNTLIRVVNGEQALEYLRDSANAEPCVVLLDLNMPKMNGVEFLKIVKADGKLRRIPVVVLTTSKADQDRFECFNCSAAGYIVKPVDYKGFVEAMRIFNLYWTLSELPDNNLDNKDVEIENVVTNGIVGSDN
ncbi:MAG: response regulator [Sedimentisphaerales bacterium]|jgi:CheY-like chemotaxis protein